MTESSAPIEARRAMQYAIWERCIQPHGNEWTTWTDAIILAEVAAAALLEAGWTIARTVVDMHGEDPALD